MLIYLKSEKKTKNLFRLFLFLPLPYVCVWVQMCTGLRVHIWRPEDDSGYFYFPLSLSTLSFHCTWSSLLLPDWLASEHSRPTVSASQGWGYRRELPHSSFTWELGIQTQFLLRKQQAFCHRAISPALKKNLFIKNKTSWNNFSKYLAVHPCCDSFPH